MSARDSAVWGAEFVDAAGAPQDSTRTPTGRTAPDSGSGPAARTRGMPARTSPEPEVDVLVPCFERPSALATTLAGLASQTAPDLRIVLSDQSPAPVWDDPAVAAMLRVLRAQGREVLTERNLPRNGLAQQRQFLLERARSPYVLFLDSDVWLEPGTLTRMLEALRTSGAGILPSGAVHIEAPTTVPDRRTEAVEVVTDS